MWRPKLHYLIFIIIYKIAGKVSLARLREKGKVQKARANSSDGSSWQKPNTVLGALRVKSRSLQSSPVACDCHYCLHYPDGATHLCRMVKSWGTERFSDLPRVTQLSSGRAVTCTQAAWPVKAHNECTAWPSWVYLAAQCGCMMSWE